MSLHIKPLLSIAGITFERDGQCPWGKIYFSMKSFLGLGTVFEPI